MAADGAKLATVADVEEAERWLAGDEADLVKAAAEAFESAVADVAFAANQTGERLDRLRGMARRHVRAVIRESADAEPVSLRAHAARAPIEFGVRVPHHDEAAGRLEALTIVRDWPGLRAGWDAEAPAIAAEMAAAAADRPPDVGAAGGGRYRERVRYCGAGVGTASGCRAAAGGAGKGVAARDRRGAGPARRRPRPHVPRGKRRRDP